MKSLEERIRELPPELVPEVEEFIDSLVERARVPRTPQQPSFAWVGICKDLRDQYTSVELQHKISEWRIGEK